MNIVELAYKEFRWEDRIDDAGGKPKKKKKAKKCRYGSVGVICFLLGVFLTYFALKNINFLLDLIKL